MSKPREFWIDLETNEPEEIGKGTRYTWAVDSAHVGYLHVIEKSPADKLAETINKETKNLKSAHQMFMKFQDSIYAAQVAEATKRLEKAYKEYRGEK